MTPEELAKEILEGESSKICSKKHWFDQHHKELAQAYLDLLKQQEGKVLVPVEPTEEMITAALDAYNFADYDGTALNLVKVYKAMIAKG